MRALATATALSVLGVAGVAGAGPADAAPAAGGPSGSGPWTVYHGDPAGRGVVSGVSAVDTAVRAWSSPDLDGQLYGEPLAYGGRVYVATENDTVYALSARTGTVDWSAHLGSPVPAGSLPCGNITPTVGITGTPVIDASRGEIFVVADVLADGRPAHRLVGLSVTTGKIELSRDVDPPGANPATLLQRTGLTLDHGQVVFGMGGNYGDCGNYRGRVVAVPESGGQPRFFTVDAEPGERGGAIWMGGAAPVIDDRGNIWVSSGNGSATSAGQAYDYSDAVLELSPSLRLVQYFAPADWAAQNARDLDMSVAPVLAGDRVLVAGKAGIAYLLDGSRLGGIGGQRATLGSVCGSDIDGGAAVLGSTVFLPCLSGIVAVRVTGSPPGIKKLWDSGTGGGPPVVAAGLVWTIGRNGVLYGLAPGTGKVERQVTLGVPANHFPTPAVGDGLLLAADAVNVVAFHVRTTTSPAAASSASPATAASAPASPQASPGAAYSPPGPGVSRWGLAAAAFGGLIVLCAIAWLGWLILRRNRRRTSSGPH